MNFSETPLVAFTICAQMAVGSFVMLGMIELVAGRRRGRRFDREAVDRLADPALYAIGPVMVLGLAASLLHLGSPFRALNSLRHFPTSPLSLEIVLGVGFAALGALFAFLQWRKLATPLLRQALAGVTAVVGLALVFAMSRVYMVPARPAWNTWFTPVSFFTTTLLLGALAVGTAFTVATARRVTATTQDDETARLLRTSLRWIAATSITVLGIGFVTLPIYLVQLVGDGHADLTELFTGAEAAFAVRLVLLFVGAGLLALFLYRAAADTAEDTPAHVRTLLLVTVTAFVLVLVAEVIGRYVFYGLADFGAAW